MAAACVHVMNLPKAHYEQHTQPMLSHINVGSGSDMTIAELAHECLGKTRRERRRRIGADDSGARRRVPHDQHPAPGG